MHGWNKFKNATLADIPLGNFKVFAIPGLVSF